MLVAQRINDFIATHAPSKYCDGCLGDALELTNRAHVAQNTAALGTTSDFVRRKEKCSVCKNDLQVIWAVGHGIKKAGA